MWQHAANIAIGLLLIAGSFLTMSFDMLSGNLVWIFAGAGILVATLAFWGFLDEVAYESGSEREELTGMQ